MPIIFFIENEQFEEKKKHFGKFHEIACKKITNTIYDKFSDKLFRES